ncbi:AAA family ATPase [Neomegalonema sp.]|uniref:AAA family ATPase n=1 Tax=Neomegalonema sp. TaxID=2039713 RepID=UPI002636045C|nr:AAA family ATPase [Neomegalonema sp.]MDD2870342.1 AAA family ATPase [Neomegalonema sp.]
MNAHSVDFSKIAREVAEKLLGEPNRHHSKGEELRWGNHGSLKVDVKAATWYDFSEEKGGGLLDLLKRELQTDEKGCFDWMRDQGFDAPAPEPAPKAGKGGGRGAARPARGQTIKAVYDYADAEGALLYQVVRYEPKEFRQRRPMADGGWAWGLTAGRYGRAAGAENWKRLKDGDRAPEIREMPDAQMVPYRLPQLRAAVAEGRVLWIVEGEKDVAALEALGLAATCNAAGAGKWRPDYAAHFVGAEVVVIPDADQPGRAHADKVCGSLAPVAARVRLLDLGKAVAGFPEKGDVSDWLAGGGTREALEALAEAAPAWEPDVPAAPFELIRFGEMVSWRPKAEWLVHEWLGRGQLGVLFGAPKTGKSFIALDMALKIAHGWEWMGKPVRKSSVFYIAAEGGEGVKKRVALWAQEHPGRDPRAPFFMAPQRFDFFEGGEEIDRLADWINAAAPFAGAPFGLIVVDTLARVFGAGDENAAADMGRIIESCDRLKAATGACVLLVHHAGKDRGRGMRGHSSLFGAVDSVLETAPEQDEEGNEVRDVKRLTLRDQKDGEAGENLLIRLRQATFDQSRHGGAIDDLSGAPATSCVVDWVRDGGEASAQDHGQGIAGDGTGSLEATTAAYEGQMALGALAAALAYGAGDDAGGGFAGVTVEAWAHAYALISGRGAQAKDHLRGVAAMLLREGRISKMGTPEKPLFVMGAPF